MSLEERVQRLEYELDQLRRGNAGVNSFPGMSRIGQDLQVQGHYQKILNDTVYEGGIFVPLQAPLTSTSWDGDSFSTTAKTLIDLSAVFGVPAQVKAVLVYAQINDSASSTTNCYLILSPNNTSGSGLALNTGRSVNDYPNSMATPVPCNADGDIYYQVVASGAGTMDIILQIWGYVL